MHFGAEDSIVLLVLLAAGAALLAIAQVVRVQYPILLVLGGLALAVVAWTERGRLFRGGVSG